LNDILLLVNQFPIGSAFFDFFLSNGERTITFDELKRVLAYARNCTGTVQKQFLWHLSSKLILLAASRLSLPLKPRVEDIPQSRQVRPAIPFV